MTETSAVPSGMTAAEYAAEHGLTRVGVRPALRGYLRELWRRRSFAVVLATSQAYAQNTSTYLGQLWAVLKPAMDALVYVIIFGVLLGTSRGLENFVAFIVVGTFMYRFFSSGVTAAAKSISGNVNLVRSLHFPRAVLPVSVVLSELASLIPALFVMVLFVLGSGLLPAPVPVMVDWYWLLLPLAVLLLAVFTLGVGLILARLAAGAPDLLNILPFLLRVLMYGSGVIFSIDRFVSNEVLLAVMQYQPIAVYLNLARQSLLDEPTIPVQGSMWAVGAAWAFGTLLFGFVYFWRAEARYGRE